MAQTAELDSAATSTHAYSNASLKAFGRSLVRPCTPARCSRGPRVLKKADLDLDCVLSPAASFSSPWPYGQKACHWTCYKMSWHCKMPCCKGRKYSCCSTSDRVLEARPLQAMVVVGRRNLIRIQTPPTPNKLSQSGFWCPFLSTPLGWVTHNNRYRNYCTDSCPFQTEAKSLPVTLPLQTLRLAQRMNNAS